MILFHFCRFLCDFGGFFFTKIILPHQRAATLIFLKESTLVLTHQIGLKSSTNSQRGSFIYQNGWFTMYINLM